MKQECSSEADDNFSLSSAVYEHTSYAATETSITKLSKHPLDNLILCYFHPHTKNFLFWWLSFFFGLFAKILRIAHISSSKNRSMTFSYVVGVMLLDDRLLSDVDNGRHKPMRANPNGIPFST